MADLEIKTRELFKRVPSGFQPLFASCEYPWEMLPKIHEFISVLLRDGLKGYRYDSERHLLVGARVSIASTAVIAGPAIIGSDVEIRPGAYIRGNAIVLDRCVIGNSTELKNCILLEDVQVPHFNYVGDSILGFRAHLGAGAICSNLRNDKKEVVIRGDREYPTRLVKVGSFIGEGSDIGCNCVLNPGTIVGSNSKAYPLVSLRGVYPKDRIIKGSCEIVEMTRD